MVSTVETYAADEGLVEGFVATPMDGVCILRACRHIEANHNLYRPSLGIVVQGFKEIQFGGEQLSYSAMQCLIVNFELPACGRIVEASPGVPFLGITIAFDVDLLREVQSQLNVRPAPAERKGRGVFVADVDERLAECLIRLLRLRETPDAIPVLYPLVLREIYYWLLTGPHGAEICKQVAFGTHMERIARAIKVLRDRFAETLHVGQLADEAGMSVSSFGQHFKSRTAMTPVQYQKQLRLLEARRLIVSEASTVSEAAFRVGYESPSQFSREYVRAFGAPPKRDAIIMRAARS